MNAEKIGCLGPEGSYSFLAAEKFSPCGEKRAYGSFALVIRALIEEEIHAAVLPIENSLNGAVTQNLDLLQSTCGIIAIRECSVKIDNRLATFSGSPYNGITNIYSHQQALAQCGEYLLKNFPAAKQIAVPSTTAGLEMLKNPSDACVVGSHIKREGITLSEQNIADVKNNFTRFLYVVKGGEDITAHSNKIFFTVTCRHRAGELLKLLECLEAYGLNMTGIYSRPVKEESGKFRFFIETEGDYSCERVKKALSALSAAAGSFKILGCY